MSLFSIASLGCLRPVPTHQLAIAPAPSNWPTSSAAFKPQQPVDSRDAGGSLRRGGPISRSSRQCPGSAGVGQCPAQSHAEQSASNTDWTLPDGIGISRSRPIKAAPSAERATESSSRSPGKPHLMRGGCYSWRFVVRKARPVNSQLPAKRISERHVALAGSKFLCVHRSCHGLRVAPRLGVAAASVSRIPASPPAETRLASSASSTASEPLRTDASRSSPGSRRDC